MAENDAPETRPEPWPLGPFNREPFGVSPPRSLTRGSHAWLRWKQERILDALPGVDLGAYDQRILDWLVTWEPATLAVITGWIKRARRDAGTECPGCDRRGLDIRQETNGDLVCHRCGRMVAPAPPEHSDAR